MTLLIAFTVELARLAAAVGVTVAAEAGAMVVASAAAEVAAALSTTVAAGADAEAAGPDGAGCLEFKADDPLHAASVTTDSAIRIKSVSFDLVVRILIPSS